MTPEELLRFLITSFPMAALGGDSGFVPPSAPLLDFSDAANSQYVPLIF